MTRSIVRNMLMAAALLGLAACGGGGGGGGGSASGGDTVISKGPIEGFGSVIVNGVKYEVEGDIVSMEADDNGTDIITGQGELRLGMNVTVHGHRNDDGVTGTATSISYDSDFKGPVSNLSPADPLTGDKTFELIGTVVVISPTETIFDDTPPISFDTITNGDFVEVSGSFDDMGRLVATFVEKKTEPFVAGVTLVEVKGTVDLHNPTLQTFLIGTLTVHYDPSDLDDNIGVLEDGLYVEVKGTVTGSDMEATKVERAGFDDDSGGVKVSIEGRITDLDVNGVGTFVIGQDMQLVDYTGNVIYEPASLEGNLADGIKVEVEGPIVDGVLLAREIKIRGGKIRIAAEVTNISNGVITFDMFSGNTVTVQLDPSNASGVGIGIGDFVELRGRPDVNDPNVIIATRIEKKSEADDFLLQGPVQEIIRDSNGNETGIRILGVTYTINGGTEYEGLNDEPLAKGAFFGLVEEGTLVKIKDKNDPSKVDENADGIADELDLES